MSSDAELLALILGPAPEPEPPPRWRLWRLRMPSGHITTAAMPAPATPGEVLATLPACWRCWPAATYKEHHHD